MTGSLPLVLVILAVAFAAAGLYSLARDAWAREHGRLDQRVDEEFLKRQREKARHTTLFKDVGKLAAELAAEERRGWRARLGLLLEQAGLDLRVRHLLILMGLAGLLVGAAAALAQRALWAMPAAGLPGSLLPLAYVFKRRRDRQEAMLAQLPEAFDAMARVLRAGHTLTQALQAALRDFRPPLAAELAYCYEQQNLGMAPQAAYHDLARRVGLFELKVFALGMSVQQQTGGNVAELLDKLAAAVRERQRARLRLGTLTAEGRLQAAVLLGLPPFLFGVLWVLRRGYAELLLRQPRLLLATVALQLLGALWVRSIVRAEE